MAETLAAENQASHKNEKVGPVLTPDIRKAVDKAKGDLTTGKLQLAWKDVKF